MSTADLGIDPNDPLSLLLHNTAQSQQSSDSSMGDDDSAHSASDSASPPDWSQLSSLWDGAPGDGAMGMKPYPDLMDFSDLSALGGSMDMDFTSAALGMGIGMGMEPGALQLHYGSDQFPLGHPSFFGGDSAAVHAFQGISAEMIPPQFNFTFQAALNAAAGSSSSSFASSSAGSLSPPESPSKERRLSVTSSSSSSSAAELSPLIESRASPSSSSSYTSDAASPVSIKQEPKTPADTTSKPKSKTTSNLDSAASELAESVRQSAGVMLAVPMSGDLAQSITMAGSGQPSTTKLNIPRVPRSAPRSPISSSSSAASTPPPSTPPMNAALSSKLTMDSKSGMNTPIMPPLASASAPSGTRPKTSHTTIERRYRTNLNARIQSLRMAVPALRVLEDRDGGNGKKIKKNLKDGVFLKTSSSSSAGAIGIEHEDGDGTTVDVIDERGFVDGVKVARKCSKANVLGKAVEYIRVLKKREMRLKAEQQGLKTLVCGLVGGPALLKEWEIRWRERFGGEEKDEVEGEDDADDDSGDEDEDDDDDGGAGRKRKRAKAAPQQPAKRPATERKTTATPAVPVVSSTQMVIGDLAIGSGAVPEKRKRGRPRKVVPPPMPVATVTPHLSHQQAAALQQQQQQFVVHQHDQVMHAPDAQRQQAQPQYMLAVFALFSFWNSPFASSFAPGSSGANGGAPLPPLPLALAPEIVSAVIPPATPVESQSRLLLGVVSEWAWKDYLHGLHLAVTIVVLAGFLWSWVGLLLRRNAADEKTKAQATAAAQPTEGAKDKKTQWTEKCDELVLSGASTVSPLALLQAYHTLSRTDNISSLTSLSLLLQTSTAASPLPLRSIARLKAASLWAQAKHLSELIQTRRTLASRPATREIEKMVFERYTTLEEAVTVLHSTSPRDRTQGERRLSPLEVLASRVLRERVKSHLGELFVEAVSVTQDEDGVVAKEAVTKDGEVDWKKREEEFEAEVARTVEGCKEVGGWIEEVGRAVERVHRWRNGSGSVIDLEGALTEEWDSDDEDEKEGGVKTGDIKSTKMLDGEIKSLLTALVLYRRMFAGTNTPTVSSMLISPPPSPTYGGSKTDASAGSKEAEMLALRRALGHRVFEDGIGDGEGLGLMEDARDRVVDLIVDTERRERRGSPL